MSATNKWELYSSMQGWEAASNALDAAAVKALEKAEQEVANGSTLVQAAVRALSDINKIMVRYRNFGACDSEPMHYVERLIQNHFQKRYGVHVDL